MSKEINIVGVTSESTGECPECGFMEATYTDHVESPTTIVDCPECGYLGKEKESRDDFDLDYESDEIN